jgi:hypothetical protein
MTTHVFYLELELLLGALLGSLCPSISASPEFIVIACLRTLNARCSKKCAVPFVLSVSARLPASIQTPTVDVWAHGECSVAICAKGSIAFLIAPRGSGIL